MSPPLSRRQRTAALVRSPPRGAASVEQHMAAAGLRSPVQPAGPTTGPLGHSTCRARSSLPLWSSALHSGVGVACALIRWRHTPESKSRRTQVRDAKTSMHLSRESLSVAELADWIEMEAVRLD
ncbi:TPA: hypothetical protein ACH3X2_002528 [Trebouxia sp. C0005]